MSYAALMDFIQDREPDYGRWTYEQRSNPAEVTDTSRYTPIYDPPRQTDVSYPNPRDSAIGGIIAPPTTDNMFLFYHHADSPDGGGKPYSVGPIYVGHEIISDGSYTSSPRGQMATQNPQRRPIARRLPASWSANIPEYGEDEF